ncbi:LptA/OstA family protein [Nodosilinea sp. PGN35]|uniref:LptA/OstA family protein n=1 Tax=Nodosilinea sp. PGN35 TaxID=3020489 RepID=UPI0023B29968|nr:LptA/OstA family protein [Nodosilinea sp. TSF1-S3]MDF0364879.1 LptA/OstA family protein [Nodosilinea sp. TSF1-S3]
MARGSRWVWMVAAVAGAAVVLDGGSLAPLGGAPAQAQDGGTITLRSDIQEANAATGIITARGNVQIDYPTRRIQATSAQADYFSNEQRIVLSGNVVVTQEGNTLRAEVVTYLIEEDRFVATPRPNAQVEAIYILPESSPAPGPAGAAAPRPPAPRPPTVLDVSPLDAEP